MIPPKELETKEFSKAVRGYSIPDVEEYIKFIVDNYTELYNEYEKLSAETKTVQAEYETIKNDEESIRTALLNAQKAGAKILKEANDRADIIVMSTKGACDRIIADFRERIVSRREMLLKVEKLAEEYKKEILRQNERLLTRINSLDLAIPDVQSFLYDDDEAVRRATEAMKNDVAAGLAAYEDELEISRGKAIIPPEAEEEEEAVEEEVSSETENTIEFSRETIEEKPEEVASAEAFESIDEAFAEENETAEESEETEESKESNETDGENA